MPAVMQLTQLNKLSVLQLRINGDNFLAFCTAMGGLEELSLTFWDPKRIQSISSVDLAKGIAALRSLRVLRFSGQFEWALAPVLHLAPSLRVLDLPLLSVREPVLLAKLSLAAPSLEIKLTKQEDRDTLQRAKEALAPIAKSSC